jgi:hypothetical protein
MLRLAFRACLLILIALSLASCAWLGRGKKARRDAEERARAASRPVSVGRVALVNASEHFALIEADLAQVPASGTKLRTYSGGVLSSELRATGVRRRPFLVADLVSGVPAKGDLVVQPAPEEPAPPPALAATAVEATPAEPPRPRFPFWKRWLGFPRRQ